MTNEMQFSAVSKLERKNIPALDGVRGIAALIVVFYHLYLRHLAWMPDGAFGVLIFFVLSGFLITWLLLKETDETGTVSLSGFYIRRSLRIFPAFYVCWFVTLMTFRFTQGYIPWGECLSTFFYVGDYYYPFHEAQKFMGFAWSLAVEEQFYLLWPFVFVACRNRRTTLAKGLCTVILLTWCYRAILKFVVHVPEHYLSYAFDCHIDHLMVGALTAITLRSGWLRSFWTAVCRPVWTVFTLSLLSLSVHLTHRFGHGYDHTLGYACDPVLIAILLVQLISLESVMPFSWLNWPVSRFFGRISYPVYLYHLYAIENASLIFPHTGWKFRVVASLALSVVFATASYFLIEKPFLRLKGRFTGRRRLAGDERPPRTTGVLALGDDGSAGASLP
jgi:peptidoglycan/LPS O-acetylase OafA/YrhL